MILEPKIKRSPIPLREVYSDIKKFFDLFKDKPNVSSHENLYQAHINSPIKSRLVVNSYEGYKVNLGVEKILGDPRIAVNIQRKNSLADSFRIKLFDGSEILPPELWNGASPFCFSIPIFYTKISHKKTPEFRGSNNIVEEKMEIENRTPSIDTLQRIYFRIEKVYEKSGNLR